jgi:hypothetical protein
MAGEYYSKMGATDKKAPFQRTQVQSVVRPQTRNINPDLGKTTLPNYPVTSTYEPANFPTVEDLSKQVGIDNLNMGNYYNANRDAQYRPLYGGLADLGSNLGNLPQITIPEFQNRPTSNVPKFNSFLDTLQEVDPNFRNPTFNQADYVEGYDPKIIEAITPRLLNYENALVGIEDRMSEERNRRIAEHLSGRGLVDSGIRNDMVSRLEEDIAVQGRAERTRAFNQYHDAERDRQIVEAGRSTDFNVGQTDRGNLSTQRQSDILRGIAGNVADDRERYRQYQTGEFDRSQVYRDKLAALEPAQADLNFSNLQKFGNILGTANTGQPFDPGTGLSQLNRITDLEYLREANKENVKVQREANTIGGISSGAQTAWDIYAYFNPPK